MARIKKVLLSVFIIFTMIIVFDIAAISENTAVDYYITIDPSNVTIDGTSKAYGDLTVKLYYTTAPDTPAQTATGSGIPSTITFGSSNPGVAYVSNGKLYSGTSSGTTTITATCDPYGNGTLVRTTTCNVTVTSEGQSTTTESTSGQTSGSTQTDTDYAITINPSNATISGTNKAYGDLTVKVYYSTNPNTAAQTATGSNIPSTITFSSSNSGVAYVSNGKLYSGSSTGTATITATCNPYGNGTMLRTATISVAVAAAEQSSSNSDYTITVDPASVTIDEMNKAYGDLTVKVYYSTNPNTAAQTATGSNIPSTITFSSSNPGVAYVSNGKLYSGSSAGTATITATCNPYGNGTMLRTATCSVTVTANTSPNINTNILLNPNGQNPAQQTQKEEVTKPEIEQNADYTMTVEPSAVSITELNKAYQDIKITINYISDNTIPNRIATGAEIPSIIKFESSNPNIAFVQNGKVYSGSTYGSAIITVTCDPYSDGTLKKTATISVIVSSSVPNKPTFQVAKDTPSAGIYTITINYSVDSIVKQYKIGNDSEYKNYAKPIEIKGKNITIYAKGQNNAGSWSTENSYTTGEAPPQKAERPKINTNIKYSDLTEKHWAYNSVMKMTQWGILEGFGDGTFHPEDKVTREQFAKVLSLSMNLQLKQPSQPTFADISNTSWSYPYVETVKQYMNQYKEGSTTYFKGKDVALREDMAVAIVVAKGLQNESPDLSVLNSFIDKNSISPSIRNLIAIAVKNNIIEGYGNGYLGPKNTLTRAEACELMYKSKILE